jgi:DNA modification methylase
MTKFYDDITFNINENTGVRAYTGDNHIFCHGDLFTGYTIIPKGSIDVIITDPPYPKEYLEYWKKLSQIASELLKPSGFLISYAPQYYLDRVMRDLGSAENMNWWCQIIMTHDRARSTLFPRKEICGYKPILVFQKSPITKPYKSFVDIIKGSGREKGLHEWQQSEAELTPLLETFTQPGDVVFDPFVGSGTTIAAAVKNGRKGIGFDRDDKMVPVIIERMAGIQ